MSIFLGFNAGGTKTDCVLMDNAGRVLAQAAAGPANPLRVGFAKACTALGTAAQRALAEGRCDASQVRAICAGIAGAGRPRVSRRITAYLQRAFPQSLVRVVTDLEIALQAAVGAGPGVVLIAGTGSASFGRNSKGATARAGGWGPWIGDPGSGYDIGRRAAEAVLQARDRIGPSTALFEKVLVAAECRDWDTFIERLPKHADALFPKIVPALIEAAGLGDQVAREILSSAALQLVRLARSVIEALALGGEAFLLAKSGGVFGKSAFLDSTVDGELALLAPCARIEPLRVSPASAAADLARNALSTAAAHGG